MMMMMMMIRLQTEAALLRAVMSGGLLTKVIVLGIGGFLDVAELHGMASPPTDSTVILVPDFSSLPIVEVELRDATCDRTCHSLSCYICACPHTACLSEHFSKHRKICFFTIQIVVILTYYHTLELRGKTKSKFPDILFENIVKWKVL